MKKTDRDLEVKRLELFIGKWEIEVIHPHFQTKIVGQTIFDWMEDKNFMVQRTTMKDPDFPGSTIVYDYDSNSDRYVQHYFDSRGVTRLYYMSLEEDTWMLWRDTSDFSPLDFYQRFVGEINEFRDEIQGTWEQSNDRVNWKHDFKLIYRKVN